VGAEDSAADLPLLRFLAGGAGGSLSEKSEAGWDALG